MTDFHGLVGQFNGVVADCAITARRPWNAPIQSNEIGGLRHLGAAASSRW
jgi:hypothetical protein